MTAFTIIGLLVFWCWCFQIGYQLGFVSLAADAFLRILLLERRFAKDIAGFSAHIAAATGVPHD